MEPGPSWAAGGLADHASHEAKARATSKTRVKARLPADTNRDTMSDVATRADSKLMLSAPMSRLAQNRAGSRALALLPPARDAGGMARPLAKLLSMRTPKRRWAQFSLATLFVVVTTLCVSSPAAELKTTIDSLVEPLTKDKQTVGLVVGVLVGDLPQVFGYGRVTTPCGELQPDGDTLFEIGSITKAFTGVLLAEAMVRNEVKLDDPANQHLPNDLQIRPLTDKSITLLHLATHRSGLAVQPPLIGLTARNMKNPYADFTRTKLVALMAALKPMREPGEKYEYSNLAVGLLGHALVNNAKAASFNTLVKDRVCRPLGMTDTSEGLTGAQKARLAHGHNAKLEPTDPWEFASLEACGGLRSSANDLLKFAAANLGKTTTPLAEALRASHEKRDITGSEAVEIGLCWHRLNLKSGEPVVWHNGGTGGYRSMLAFTPGTDRAVVVLCAADLGQQVDKLALEVLTAVQPN